MSFEEPKAPIVRIRKKKTKKKSKEHQIVHLPVRASRQTRYSSLTTPANPQTKGRECCRRFMASCLKIPLCNKMCLGCILPPCYDGEKGSDDEEHNVKDEGYHSQVRGSSEVPAMLVAVAHGSAEPSTSDATEVKTETVALIPPPRTAGNDYRQDPCCSTDSTQGACASVDNVTYIEVETLNLSDICSAENSDEDTASSMKDFVARNSRVSEHEHKVEFVEMQDLSAATEYEVPVSLRQSISTNDDTTDGTKVIYSLSGGPREYTNDKGLNYDTEQFECDSIEETRQYVNMDVLKYDKDETKETGSHELQNDDEDTTDYLKVNVVTLNNETEDDNTPHDYANLSALKGLEAEHDRVSQSKIENSNDSQLGNHDYINLSSLSSNSTSVDKKIDVKPDGGTNSAQDNTHGMNGINTHNHSVVVKDPSVSGLNISVEKIDTMRGINGKRRSSNLSRGTDSNATAEADMCNAVGDLEKAVSDSDVHVDNVDKRPLLIKTSKKDMKNGMCRDSDSEDVVLNCDQLSDQTKLI